MDINSDRLNTNISPEEGQRAINELKQIINKTETVEIKNRIEETKEDIKEAVKGIQTKKFSPRGLDITFTGDKAVNFAQTHLNSAVQEAIKICRSKGKISDYASS